jgi:hypothetical protein
MLALGAHPAKPKLEAQAVEVPAGLRAAFSLTDPAQAGRRGVLVQTDVNAMFVSAAQSLELGTGEPVEVSNVTAAELRRPGFVVVADPDPAWPAPFHSLQPGDPLVTGMARVLAEWLEAEPAALGLVDGLVWPQHRRWLRSWAQRCLRARKALVGAPDAPSRMALVVLKAIYTGGLGMLASGPATGDHNHTAYLRPDWSALVRGQAQANMWRHLHHAQPTPVAVITDAALFVVPKVGDVPAELPISDQPGKFKIERWARLSSAVREAIRAGQPGNVRRLAHDQEVTP